MLIGKTRLAVVSLVLLVAAVQTGCSRKTSTASNSSSETSESTEPTSNVAGVATIDVNQIATDSGTLVEINRELDKREADFNLILEGLRKIHLDNVAALEKKHGDKPSAEQKKEVAELRARQTREYNVEWQDSRLKLTAIKQKLDEQFLSKLQPLAKKVAKEKGLSVVIRQENVFCLVDQFDITTQVSSEFKKAYPVSQQTPVVEVANVPSRGGEFVPKK